MRAEDGQQARFELSTFVSIFFCFCCSISFLEWALLNLNITVACTLPLSQIGMR